MSVENAWNPLAVALVATAAAALQALSGFVNCDFVQVTAQDGEVLAITETSAQQVANSTEIGLTCDGDFYDLDGDDMRMYSRLFFFGATGLGGLCMLTAWTITFCLQPTMCTWRIMAFLSSASALVSLPTFLVLESYPCADFDEQTCTLSTDSYYLMGAVALYVLVTALTQFLDPPEWAGKLHPWRVPRMRTMETNYSSEDDDGSNDPILTPRLAPPKPSLLTRLRTKKHHGQSDRDSDRQIVQYAPPPTDLEQGDSLIEEEVVSTQESDQPPSPGREWTEFETESSPFKEKDSVEDKTQDETQDDNTPDQPEPRALYNKASYHTQEELPEPRALYKASNDYTQELSEPRALYEGPISDAKSGPMLSSSSSRPPVTPVKYNQSTEQRNPATPLAASLMQRAPGPNILSGHEAEQTPISPLTHGTMGSAPNSPLIERTTVQDPILQHGSSRFSSPSRQSVGSGEPGLDDTELTTPVKRLTWAQHESVLDGVNNGDESILDSSYESDRRRGVPFIPSVEESKVMATRGSPVYEDLLKEDQTKDMEPPSYNIDELVNRGSTGMSSGDSLLGADDVKAIALEGTPIYASLLMEQDKEATDDKRKLTKLEKSLSNQTFPSEEGDESERAGNGDGKASNNLDARRSESKSTRNIGAALQRRTNNGYDKLVDAVQSDEEDLEEDVPPMTEVSFDPSEIQEVSLDKDEIHRAENKSEQALLDDWNKMFDDEGPIPLKLQETRREDEDEEDRQDEEELLRLISSEDFSDESPGSKDEEEENNKGQSSSASPDRPPRSGGKPTTLRPKRRSRRSRSRASGSVGSSPSLLSVTIEEETQSDLEDFNKEERTSLSSYAPESKKTNRNVTESLNMSGMHAYTSVEDFRSKEQEVDKITAGVQEVLRRSRSRTISVRSQDERGKSVRSLSPNVTRESTWRSERENRAGIHDVPLVSDDGDSNKNDAGRLANELRQSRIQRLQQRTIPDLSERTKARLTRQRLLFEAKTPLDKKPVKPAQKTPSGSTQTQPSRLEHNPSPRMRVSPGDDGSATTTPDDMSGGLGSFFLNTADLDMVDLEVSLAALSRPDGSEYGPDEHSI